MIRSAIRSALHALVAVAALTTATLAGAQTSAGKPIRLICPFPPAGAVDIASRAIAAELSKVLGVTVTVENKPGAGGNLGGAEAARSPADGTTLFMTHQRHQRHQPGAVRQDAVRPHQGPGARGGAGVAVERAGGAPLGQGQLGGRGDGAGPRRAGQDELRLVGQRHQHPHVGRDVQVPGQARHPAHPVQGQRAGRHRPAGRPGDDDVRQHPLGAAAHQGRQAASAGPSPAPSATRCCPTCPR